MSLLGSSHFLGTPPNTNQVTMPLPKDSAMGRKLLPKVLQLVVKFASLGTATGWFFTSRGTAMGRLGSSL
jgi:hypothetical protein